MAVAEYTGDIIKQTSTNNVLIDHTFKVIDDCIEIIDKAIIVE